MEQTEKQKTFFGRLIADFGAFLLHLFTGAKNAFNDLPPQQQQDIINGVNISQIIKDGYTKGEQFVVDEVSKTLNLPVDVTQQVILTGLKDIGINVTSIQAGFDQLAAKIQAGITDTHWNSLWQTVASSAAQWLSTGSLNWVSLAMGLIEWAFQHFVKAPASN